MKILSEFDNSLDNKASIAYMYAANKHTGQQRKHSSDAYIWHPLAVSEIVGQITKDYDMMCAALLHDVVEDTETTIEEIADKFGFRVASLVNELTDEVNEKKRLGKKNYLAKKLNTMSSDALLIKLADRFHNVFELRRRNTPRNFIKWYWKETIFILRALNRELLEEHKVLLDLIRAELGYLKIVYNFIDKGKEDGT